MKKGFDMEDLQDRRSIFLKQEIRRKEEEKKQQLEKIKHKIAGTAPHCKDELVNSYIEYGSFTSSWLGYCKIRLSNDKVSHWSVEQLEKEIPNVKIKRRTDTIEPGIDFEIKKEFFD